MLTIFLGVSLLVITIVALQKWIRLKKSSAWPSDSEFERLFLEDATLSPVVDYVCGCLYNNRVERVCRDVLTRVTSSTERTHRFALAHTKKARHYFEDLAKGKHKLRGKGPASFFLKRISEHKKNAKRSE